MTTHQVNGNMANGPLPAVSIILPTYNRAKFLPRAFASIKAQQFPDWELIVVDDGSTDNTRQLVIDLSAGLQQPVRYINQDNQGAFAARNAGLDHASGHYVAFFDSDDIWLPHHLADCVKALDANQEVDWVYGASRSDELHTGRTLAASSFYANGRPRPFLRLHHKAIGRLRIFDDPATIRCMIRHGLGASLQASVFRAKMFARLRLSPYHIGEDQMLLLAALLSGFRLAYFDNVHFVYCIHDGNISGAALGNTLERRVWILQEEARGWQDVLNHGSLTVFERNAVRWRLLQQFFWKIGYALLWQHGKRGEALEVFRRGLGYWPWDLRCWKTYLLASLRVGLTRSSTALLRRFS